MRIRFVVVLASLLLACTAPAVADTCTPKCGYTGAITAQLTGTVSVSFLSKDANFYDWVKIKDVTSGQESAWGLNNQICDQNPDQCPSLTLSVTGGDSILLELCVVPDWEGDHNCKPSDEIFFTSKGLNPDGAFHAKGPVVVPPPLCGTNCQTIGGQIWFEDFDSKYWGGIEPDYNDEVIQFAGLTVGVGSQAEIVTPEPASCILLGTGLLAACFRKLNK